MPGRSRILRRGGRAPAGFVSTYRSILGPLLVEMWDARRGVARTGANVTSWTGGVLGTVLSVPAANPQYAADGTHFLGKPVVQTAVSGSTGLRIANTGSTFLATGLRPWTFSVTRLRALGAVDNTQYTMLDFGVNATSDRHLIQHFRNVGATVRNLRATLSGATATGPDPFDTSPHTVQAWLDGANANLTVDTTNYQTASVQTLGANCTAIGVGCAASAAVQFSDFSHALHLVCSAKPSAGQIAAIKALSFRDWGV